MNDTGFIERHLGLVDSVARSMKAHLPPSFELDDLIQAGRMGLVLGARTFDASVGTPEHYWARMAIRMGIYQLAASSIAYRQAGHLSEYEYAKRRISLAEIPEPSAPAPEEDTCGIVTEVKHLLDDAMESLTTRQHAVIDLIYEYGCNLREVGAKLGTSKDTASREHHRALKILREKLTELNRAA